MRKSIISEEKLLELLPHGAGIDCDWSVIMHNTGNISARNYFRAMDENGFYDGYMPFKVRIFRHEKDVFNPLRGQNKTQVIARKGDIDFSLSCRENSRKSFYGLKDYLEDTIGYCLESIITDRNEVIYTQQQQEETTCKHFA